VLPGCERVEAAGGPAPGRLLRGFRGGRGDGGNKLGFAVETAEGGRVRFGGQESGLRKF